MSWVTLSLVYHTSPARNQLSALEAGKHARPTCWLELAASCYIEAALLMCIHCWHYATHTLRRNTGMGEYVYPIVLRGCNYLSKSHRMCSDVKMVLRGFQNHQWSAVITRSNITQYFIQHYVDWSRTKTRMSNHKLHPIYAVFFKNTIEHWPRHNGTALYIRWSRQSCRTSFNVKTVFSSLRLDKTVMRLSYTFNDDLA